MITVSSRCQVPEVASQPVLHSHHWLIDGQQGPVSPAVCKACGCHREFSNSFVRGWGPPRRRQDPQAAVQSRETEATVVSN
jgi:hypothetical protein